MIIANPIYDVVFKRLMEDKRIAKFFIETLVEESIDEIQVKPQEFTYSDQMAGLAVFRLDFIATIKTGDNQYKKVLIEIQKAKNPIDLMRFRNYLGEQYKKADEIEINGNKEKSALPIITIYLLGFKLPKIDTAAVKVNRQYFDLITKQIIHQKSDFIEKLTHDCYIVQMPRIQGKLQNRLEQVLSIFEQDFFADENGIIKEYNYQIDNDIINNMIAILHKAGTDPKERREIENEQEAYRILDLAASEKTKELEVIINEKDKALKDKDKALEDKDKALKDKDKEITALKKLLKK